MSESKRDQNFVTTITGVSSLDLLTPTLIAVDPVTHGIIIDADSLYAGLDSRYVPFTLFDQTKDPSGFVSPDDVVVNYNSTTKKITLTGTVTAYWRGKVITELVSGWESPAISGTPIQPYFLSYDGSTFSWSTSPWTFDKLQIAYVYYRSNGTFLFGLRETHGFMPWQDHLEFHQTLGCYKTDGGVFSSYTPDSTTASDRRPDISETTIKDEDLNTTNPAFTSKSYTQAYLTNGGSITSTWANADIVPLSGANPYWNEYSGGVWNQTLMGNNTYMSVWVVCFPSTSDTESQRYNYFFIQGQSNGTLVSEQAKTPNDLNLGGLLNISAEFVFIGRIIIRYTASDWSITQVDTLSGTKLSQTISSVATTNHNALPGLQGGTINEYYHLTSAEYTAAQGVSTTYLKLDLSNAPITGTSLTWNGNAARDLTINRHTTTNTAGSDFSISSGGATIGATNKAGGTLILNSGISTGNSRSKVAVAVARGGGTSGTTDVSQTQLFNFFAQSATTTSLEIGASTGTVTGLAVGHGVGIASTADAGFEMYRNTVTNTAGKKLYVIAGAATSGSTDKAGGTLILRSGISTGTGVSEIQFATTTPAGSTGTSDNSYATRVVINHNGLNMQDGQNIVLQTTTGTKIGTSTTQKLGFFNATPIVQPSAYTASNVTTDRTFDANSTSIDELADILGTLITDLKALGLIG